ncbi:MAG: redoxin domain-containing protein [Planctomycetes bacterium]|nr:redoxin domain-containing protein [Planctomycetota bacterium]
MKHTIIHAGFALSLLAAAGCKNEIDRGTVTAPSVTSESSTESTKDRPTELARAPEGERTPVVALPVDKPAEPKAVAPTKPVLGKLAPEISGEDIDGKPFKLSDYRGKVVMLDFWGHW